MQSHQFSKTEYFRLMNTCIKKLQAKPKTDIKEMYELSKQIKYIREILKIGTKL